MVGFREHHVGGFRAVGSAVCKDGGITDRRCQEIWAEVRPVRPCLSRVRCRPVAVLSVEIAEPVLGVAGYSMRGGIVGEGPAVLHGGTAGALDGYTVQYDAPIVCVLRS